jgi:hypothetical protein
VAGHEAVTLIEIVGGRDHREDGKRGKDGLKISAIASRRCRPAGRSIEP